LNRGGGGKQGEEVKTIEEEKVAEIEKFDEYS